LSRGRRWSPQTCHARRQPWRRWLRSRRMPFSPRTLLSSRLQSRPEAPRLRACCRRFCPHLSRPQLQHLRISPPRLLRCLVLQAAASPRSGLTTRFSEVTLSSHLPLAMESLCRGSRLRIALGATRSMQELPCGFHSNTPRRRPVARQRPRRLPQVRRPHGQA
jgi:hypothetical protein